MKVIDIVAIVRSQLIVILIALVYGFGSLLVFLQCMADAAFRKQMVRISDIIGIVCTVCVVLLLFIELIFNFRTGRHGAAPDHEDPQQLDPGV